MILVGGLIGCNIYTSFVPLNWIGYCIRQLGANNLFSNQIGKEWKKLQYSKIRTMFVDAEKNGNLNPAEENDEE